MLTIEDLRPASGIANEVFVILRVDVRALPVDAIQTTDDDIVRKCHHTGSLCIRFVWLL